MQLTPGDIFWLNLEGRVPHPVVIVSEKDGIIMGCEITTDARKASMPGNVVLSVGMANLVKQSIVQAAKYFVVNEGTLDNYIGTIQINDLNQVLAGVEFVNKLRRE